LTGSNDYTVRFWDFAGMDSSHRSFREVEPHSGHQVRSLSYSITGDQFLVATGSAKPKIYSRDGHELYVTPTAMASVRRSHWMASNLNQCRVRERRHVPARHVEHQGARGCAVTRHVMPVPKALTLGLSLQHVRTHKAVWHPTDANTFMTSAADSTIRLWDANDTTKQKTVIKFKDARNTTRLPVTRCAFNHDGSLIAGSGEVAPIR